MSELIDKLRAQAEPLSVPVAGDHPAGQDVSYDADFEVVRLEMDKLTSMAGEVPDWGAVVAQGESLLKERSKDMRLLVWVAAGRMKRDGMLGLALGLAGISLVCSAHWDGMYPPIKRAKARGNLAGWLGDLVLAEFGEYIPTARDRDGFEAAETLFNEVDELLGEKLGANYQGMGPIRSLLRDKKRMIPEAAPPPAPAQAAAPAEPTRAPAAASAPVAAAPAPAAAMAVPQIPNVNSGDVMPALRVMGKGIADAAGHVRSAQPSSAWAFRLNRLGTWLTVQEPPPDEGGKTRVPAPDDSDMSRLSTLFQRQQWAELVNQSEDMVGQYLFWLDPHRFAAQGLERLGPGYEAARKAVVSEVLTFVEAQPVLLSLTFSDGTPFADEATRSWIDEERAKSGGGSGGEGGHALKVDEEEVELQARFETAREMVTEGKVGEGLSLAMQLARRAADARACFRSKLETARMALKASRPDLARPILEGLVQEAEEHGLEHWEPVLCAQLYSSLLKARTAKGATQGADLELSNERIFDRLCRLDPAAAMKAAPPV